MLRALDIISREQRIDGIHNTRKLGLDVYCYSIYFSRLLPLADLSITRTSLIRLSVTDEPSPICTNRLDYRE